MNRTARPPTGEVGGQKNSRACEGTQAFYHKRPVENIPYSQDSASTIIGALIGSATIHNDDPGKRIEENNLTSDLFLGEDKDVFEDILSSSNQGLPISLESIYKRTGIPASNISQYPTNYPSDPVFLDIYIKKLRDDKAKRLLLEVAESIKKHTQDPQCNISETVPKIEAELQAIQFVERKSRLNVADIRDFMSREFPPRENILDPWLPRQGLAMVYGPRGIGKSHFSLGVANAVASGGKFLSWDAPSARSVLFIDGELPASVLQERLTQIVASSDKEPTAPFKIITPDLQPSGIIDLANPMNQRELLPYLDGIELIIVDNLSCLCRTGRENEGEAWLPVQEWALVQRALGRSVLFIHHAGKNGEQRGSSRREDVLDTVISLRRPCDYSPDKGACFEVHFEKSRGILGDDVKPFEAQLTTTPDALQAWAIRPVEDSTAEKVAKLLNEGIPQNEIAELLGITKGAVSKAKKKAMGNGLIKSAN